MRATRKIMLFFFPANDLALVSRKEYEDTRKMKRVSFMSVKASMTGKKKATAAKEEQEYHVAFEREKACALQLEQLSEELNQATMLVCFIVTVVIRSQY
jgi:hypothetical protein